MFDEPMRLRLEAALAAGTLYAMAQALHAEGYSQVAVYDLFESLANALHNEERHDEAEPVEEALDCIWGYCPPSAMWFPETLTTVEVNAYRRTQTEAEKAARVEHAV